MKATRLIAISAIALVLLVPISVQAFECPGHFKKAQAAIDKATAAVKKLSGRAIAKADAARGQAEAALILAGKY